MLFGITDFSYIFYIKLSICFIVSLWLCFHSGKLLPENSISKLAAIVLYLYLSIALGFRGYGFNENGDTWLYAYAYNHPSSHFLSGSDYVWWKFMQLSYDLGISVSVFFFIVALGYVGCMLYVCYLLFPKHVFIGFLFCIVNFSFTAYGMNGIRNGLSTSIMLVSIVYFIKNKKSFKLIGIGLGILAMAIHKSAALPFLMLIISVFVIKSFKQSLIIWVISIALSLIVGSSLANFFINLGFDSRLDNYLSGTANANIFSHTGFRYDFLIYSSLPVIMGWYIFINKGIKDRVFLTLASTYTLSNAFWVIINRVPYSNRFAYLSWFLYSIIIAYPFLKCNIWNNQSRTLGIALIGYALLPIFF